MSQHPARRALAALLLATAAGCGGGESPGGGGGGGFQFPPTAVEVAPVQRGSVSETFETVGTVEAREAVTIVSEIDGIVVALPFREGESVQSGAVIARLDDAEVAATLARAEAVRDQRQASYDRVARVVEQRAGAPQDLDDARAALQVAEADAALARARLAKTRITAPFSGIVGRRAISPGAFVRAGQAITELVQLDELDILFAVPERYAGQLRRDAAVDVTSTAYPGYVLTGRVDVIDPNVDATTRNVQVLARVSNPDRRFLPGMSAGVRAVLSSRDSALTIPSEAVFAEGEQFLAYVVQPDSTVTRATLKLGTRLSGSVEVLEGLSAGDVVIRAGHQKLFPGAKVIAVNSRETAPAEGSSP
jgi:membrane fusion protein (multidrug efflux system)